MLPQPVSGNDGVIIVNCERNADFRIQISFKMDLIDHHMAKIVKLYYHFVNPQKSFRSY
jgi:hypothetical protein